MNKSICLIDHQNNLESFLGKRIRIEKKPDIWNGPGISPLSQDYPIESYITKIVAPSEEGTWKSWKSGYFQTVDSYSYSLSTELILVEEKEISIITIL